MPPAQPRQGAQGSTKVHEPPLKSWGFSRSTQIPSAAQTWISESCSSVKEGNAWVVFLNYLKVCFGGGRFFACVMGVRKL